MRLRRNPLARGRSGEKLLKTARTMPNQDETRQGDPAKLSEILGKILKYQNTLPDGRSVELDELKRERILSPEDLEFMSAHSVTYKPRKSFAYRRGGYVLKMTTENGYISSGLKGEPLEHRSKLRNFPLIIERLFAIPESGDELLLLIKFPEDDWIGVLPGIIIFNIRSDSWRQRLPAIRATALELGFEPTQDYESQESHALIHHIPRDAASMSAAVTALLSRGCGFSDEAELTYSSPALDEA